MVAEGVVVRGCGRAHHLFVDGAHLVHLAAYRRAGVVVGTAVKVVLHRGVVVREDALYVQPLHQVQRQGLHGRDAAVDAFVLTLIHVVELVLGIAAVAAGPGGARLVVGRPVETPEQVARLHEEVIPCAARIVVSALVGAAQADVRSEFHPFAHLLREVHASADAVEAVHLDASLVLGVGEGGVVVRGGRSAAHAQVVGLIDCRAEVGIFPVEVLACSARFVVFANRYIFEGARSAGRELVAVLIELLVQLLQGVGVGILIAVAIAGGVVVEHGVEHVYLLLHAGSLVVVCSPAGGEANRGLQSYHRFALPAPLGGNQHHAVGSAAAVER